MILQRLHSLLSTYYVAFHTILVSILCFVCFCFISFIFAWELMETALITPQLIMADGCYSKRMVQGGEA